jgi:hypothetical protein
MFKIKIERTPKPKGRFSKRIIILMLLFLLLFTVSNIGLFYLTGNEPSTLITCVFAFCGAEGGYLAFVKKLKNKGDNVDGI